MEAGTARANAAPPVALPGSIFLVGLMGAGKTSAGRALARRLGKSFYDSDHEIEKRTGVAIPVIFEIEGEAGFREREAAVLRELAALPDIVLATGGGAVLREDNRRVLRAGGTVIYLRALPNDLWLRTRHDRNRPLLQTADPLATLEQLYAERDPLYRETAHVVVDSGRQSLRTLMQKTEKLLHSHLAGTGGDGKSV